MKMWAELAELRKIVLQLTTPKHIDEVKYWKAIQASVRGNNLPLDEYLKNGGLPPLRHDD